MTKTECRRLVRRVSDGRVTSDELGTVLSVIVDEMLLRDRDTTVAFLHSLRDDVTKH